MRMCLEFTGFFLLISILSQVNGGKLLVSGSEKPPTLSEDMEAQNGELERRILIVEDEKKDSLNKIEQQKTQIKEDLEGKIIGLEIEMIQMKEELKQKLYEAQTKCQGEKDALEHTEALFANTSLTTNLINSNRDTIEQQARIIQMQSKSISLLRPLLGSNPNKTDIPCFNKAEDGAILETSSCGCLPRATQPTSLMPSRIEYLCEGEGNRSYSWECESGVCGTEEFPSCEETVLWENETVLWDNCQEVNFNGITHLCGEGSMEERKTKTIGAGLMTEVVSTPCGDCGDLSTALDWQPWGSCMDGEGNVDRPDIQCRKRGNGKIGFQEEERVIDGEWGSWGSCNKGSETCGEGIRKRKCNNPPPKNGGNDCVGENEENCEIAKCPIDGVWEAWGSCSKTCGTGKQTRKCKPPRYGGNDCVGENEQDCFVKHCPIDGGWGDWETCNETCGRGKQTRKCDKPPKQYGGNDCKGENEQDCHIKYCPIDGGWGALSTCSKTCGGGNQTRKCDNPPKQYGGNDCKGENELDCNTNACPDPIYHVSGISTKQVTAKIGSTIWTDRSHSSDKAQYFITKMPDELVGSTLFQPTHYVAISTIQISLNQRAMIYVGVHESRDGGLMEELPKLGWKLENGWFIEWNRGIGARLQKIWSIQIEAGQSTTFTTTKDRMTFAIFVSEAEYKVSYRVSSSGEAGEYRSNQMGDYFPTGDNVNQFPIYRKGQEFLYVNTLESWMIGPKAGVATGWILNPKKNPTPSTPPVTGWKFGKSAGWKFWNDGTWQDDISLTVVPFFQ